MSSNLEATQKKVQNLLKIRFPHAESFGDGSFAIPFGSSSVMVVVRNYTETDTMVEILSQVVTGANITSEVMHWLLRKNAELHFGAFGLLFDNTIIFSHGVSGETVNESDLEAAILSVATISDHYDDELVAMAGGKRSVDVEL